MRFRVVAQRFRPRIRNASGGDALMGRTAQDLPLDSEGFLSSLFDCPILSVAKEYRSIGKAWGDHVSERRKSTDDWLLFEVS